MRVLAVGARKRMSDLPDVPTLEELGIKDANTDNFQGIFAPAGTPQPVIDKLNAAIRTGVANTEYRKRLDELGSVPPTDEEMKPEFVKQFVPQEIAKFRDLLADEKPAK